MRPARLLFAASLLFVCITSRADMVEVVPPELRGAAQPQVAIAPDGVVFVVFGKGSNIYCAVSAKRVLQFQKPVHVASLPKLALGMRRGPRVAAAGKGVVVSAISHADGNLYAWTSSDRGATWSLSIRINSSTNAAREGMHAMAGGGEDTVHAAWLDLRNGKTELWGATSRDGGRGWDGNALIYQSPDGFICECCHPSLAVDPSGRVWAMWRNSLGGARDMFASESRDGGRTFYEAHKLGSGTWPLNACPMDGGHLAFDAAGRPVTVWRRAEAIYFAREGNETKLSATGRHPVVGMNRAGELFLWQQGSKLMLQRGEREPVMFADPGAFASIATPRPISAAVVVWESVTNGVKTILAGRVD